MTSPETPSLTDEQIAMSQDKIDRDEAMDRSYIPLPGGWELQTKGKGSTLRLLDKKTGERFPLPLPDFVIAFIERMAREIHVAVGAEGNLATHAIEELHQLGYTVRNGLLYPPAAETAITEDTPR